MSRATPLRLPFASARPRLASVAYWLVGALFIAGTVAGALSVKGLDGGRRQDLSAYVQQLVGAEASPARPPAAQLVADALWNEGVRTVGLMWLLGPFHHRRALLSSARSSPGATASALPRLSSWARRRGKELPSLSPVSCPTRSSPFPASSSPQGAPCPFLSSPRPSSRAGAI